MPAVIISISEAFNQLMQEVADGNWNDGRIVTSSGVIYDRTANVGWDGDP